MRKLKLDLTALEVTSFQVADEHDGGGTVVGHKYPAPSQLSCAEQTCEPATYVGQYTCDWTHAESCYNGCATAHTVQCGGCQAQVDTYDVCA